MIERKIANELMRRFGGMPSTPTAKSDCDLRRDALQSQARSDAHARAIVDHLLSKLTFFPTVANFAQAAEDVLDPGSEQAAQVRSGCAQCEGTGWHIVKGPFFVTAASPCDHRVQSDTNTNTAGIRLSASLQRVYAREMEQAQIRRAEWVAAGSPPFERWKSAR